MSDRIRWNPTPEALLSEHGWARRLARRLVGEDATAEDVAQEACLRALERPPDRSPRGWLAGIVRNLAREQQRERIRRTRREELAARPEGGPSASEALERLSVQQDVVRAVLGLTEPYRSTIVLRFYENLPPRRIAARQGIPVATVKSRLQRGLAELRSRLDQQHGGDGRSWALFLAPLAFPPRTGLLAGPSAIVLATGGAAAGLVLVSWLARGPGDGSTTHLEPAPNAAASTLASAPARAPTPPGAARQAFVPGTPANPAALVSGPEVLLGRVVDLAGAPVGGVTLALRESHGSRMDAEGGARLWSGAPLEAPHRAASDALGGFALELPQPFSGAIVSLDERYETVLAPDAYLVPGYEPVVVVAPGFRLSGRVRAPDGAALAGVEVRLDLPSDLIRRIDADLHGTEAMGWFAETDDEGRFDLGRLPAVPGAHLLARRTPFEDRRLPLEPWIDQELELVLREPSGSWLEGVALADGTPVAGALVTLGHSAVVCDGRGEFRLPLAGLEHARELCALAPGRLPARLQGGGEPDGPVRWPAFVRLELAGGALALAGRVTGPTGLPAADHEIWLADPSVSHRDALGYPVLLESALVGQAQSRHGTRTDAEGRFRLEGLEARAYRLQVIDPATALLVEEGPFAAGRSDLALQLPADALHALVRGTVRDREGAPLAGLHVHVSVDAGCVGVDDHYWGFLADGARARTAADGTFELRGVPRAGAVLRLAGAGVVASEFELGPGLDPLGLQLTAGVRVGLRVTVSGALEGASHFACLDGAGAVVEIETPSQGGIERMWSHALVSGRSAVVRVGDEARTLVLYAGEEELARVPLVLRTDELNRVDL